ncbi:DUF4124 domain-containing protein [uncultured Ferrimonas sp.]|uniref:DUF4124 domain-containing protein n=1 Tax=uncultured Ferrimonas sp. TaxID=432640 RepID=UPI0026303F13|nr:DUF4124 domain-containing protein [uncultured Ferrimonas sp.]
MRAQSLLVLMLMTMPVDAALYRWVDENGKVHYSDKKPSKKQKSDQLEMRRSGLVLKDGKRSPAADNAVTTLTVEPSEKRKEFQVIKTRTIPQPEDKLDAAALAAKKAKELRLAADKAEAEAKLHADAKAKAEAEAQAIVAAKAKAEAEAKAKAEAEAQAIAAAKAEQEAQALAAQQAKEQEQARLLAAQAQAAKELAAKQQAEKEQAEQQRAAQEQAEKEAQAQRLAAVKAEAERKATEELKQARVEMLELLRRAQEAEAKALEAARIATEKLAQAERERELAVQAGKKLAPPPVRELKPQPEPQPQQPVAVANKVVPAAAKPVLQPAAKPAVSKPKAPSFVAKSKPKPKPEKKIKMVAKKLNKQAPEPDDGLNCKVASNNAKTSLQKMISVNNKNFKKGYLPKANYTSLNQALHEIGWRISESECKRSRDQVRAFYRCMADDVSHLSECGKQHNYGTL